MMFHYMVRNIIFGITTTLALIIGSNTTTTTKAETIVTTNECIPDGTTCALNNVDFNCGLNAPGIDNCGNPCITDVDLGDCVSGETCSYNVCWPIDCTPANEYNIRNCGIITGYEYGDPYGNTCGTISVDLGQCNTSDDVCLDGLCTCISCDMQEITPSSPITISEESAFVEFFYLPLNPGDQVTCSVNIIPIDYDNPYTEFALTVDGYAGDGAIHNDCITEGYTSAQCSYIGPATADDDYLIIYLYFTSNIGGSPENGGQATLQCDTVCIPDGESCTPIDNTLNCGEVPGIDSCGDPCLSVVVDLRTCPVGQICENNICTTECISDGTTCILNDNSNDSFNCGNINAPGTDNCGSPCTVDVDLGGCSADETCSYNFCWPADCTPTDDSGQCGTINGYENGNELGNLCGTSFDLGPCNAPNDFCLDNLCISDVQELTPSSPIIISNQSPFFKLFYLPLSIGDQVICNVNIIPINYCDVTEYPEICDYPECNDPNCDDPCELDPGGDECLCYMDPYNCRSDNPYTELALRVDGYPGDGAIFNDCISSGEGTSAQCSYGPAALGDEYLFVGLYFSSNFGGNIEYGGQATLQCDNLCIPDDDSCTVSDSSLNCEAVLGIDSCGDTCPLYLGTCPEGQSCEDNICTTVCIPDGTTCTPNADINCGADAPGTDNCNNPCVVDLGGCMPGESCVSNFCWCEICDFQELLPSQPWELYGDIDFGGVGETLWMPISIGETVTCTINFEVDCGLIPFPDNCDHTVCYDPSCDDPCNFISFPDICAYPDCRSYDSGCASFCETVDCDTYDSSRKLQTYSTEYTDGTRKLSHQGDSDAMIVLYINEFVPYSDRVCSSTASISSTITECAYGPALTGDEYVFVDLYVSGGQATLQCDKTTSIASSCYVDNTCTTNICASFSVDNQALCIVTEAECADYGGQGWSTDGGTTCSSPAGETSLILGFCYCDDLCPSEDVKFDHGVLLTQIDCESINYGDMPCLADDVTSCSFTSYSWYTLDGGSACTDFVKTLDPLDDPFACGDPHFMTFGGKPYEYHGECDLVLISNPSFANGLGLDVHARTTRHHHYSFINEIGIRIGKDIMEVHSMGEFKINGVPGDLMNTTATKFGDYKFAHWHSGKAYFHRYYIKIGDAGEKFDIRAFENIIYFEVGSGGKHILKGSTGMLGDEATGLMLGRDGVTVVDDPEMFAMEWQVRDTDIKLFSNDRPPQYPHECLPAQTFTSRLGHNNKLQEQAEKLCANAGWVTEIEKNNCIFDVMATGNIELVKYKEIEADAFKAENIIL